jgi:hypothetical protein
MRRRTHSEYEIQRASLCRGSEVILSFSDSCPQRWQEHVPDGKKPPVIPYHPKPSILNNAERKKDAQMITIRLAQVIPSAARLRPPDILWYCASTALFALNASWITSPASRPLSEEFKCNAPQASNVLPRAIMTTTRKINFITFRGVRTSIYSDHVR